MPRDETRNGGCALRVSQVVALRAGQVFDRPPASFSRRTSERQRGTVVQEDGWPHFKEVWDDEVFQLLRALQARTPAGELLFPRSQWTLPQYRKTVQLACRNLRFPTSLKFDGSHVLRHAGTAAAVRTLSHLAEEERAKKMCMSHRMVEHYARSLDQRLAAAQTKQKRRTAKKSLAATPKQKGL